MLEFYRLSESLRIAASALSTLAVILFLMAALICAVQRLSALRLLRVAETLLLTLMFFHALTLLGLIAEAQLGIGTGFILRSGMVTARYLLLGVTAPVAAFMAVRLKRAGPLVLLLPMILILPISEQLSGRAFPVLFFLAVSADLASAVLVIVRAERRIDGEMSGASVKQAIDSLHTGIMFCEPDGYILLLNRRMQRLMKLLTGEIQRNGKKFYGMVLSGDCSGDYERIEIEDETAYRTPDGKVWLFSKSDIAVKRSKYVEIAATDITERWLMTEELAEQRYALLARGGELQNAIAGVQQQCREEESLRLKEEYHNLLGHRIVLLLRALREKREPDEALLGSLALDPIAVPESVGKKAKHRLDSLKTALAGIGVSLNVTGPLPPDDELAVLAVDTITECSTNAVRHGFATRVDALLDRSDGQYSIKISDNGIPPMRPLREGGGLGGLRRRVLELGGSLSIETSPRFIIRVKIPAGENL